MCLASCAQCGHGACCTDSCQDVSSCVQTCAGCSCMMSCQNAPAGCDFLCRAGSHCGAISNAAGTIVLTCQEGSFCDLQCNGQAVSCNGTCTADSACVLRCGSIANCNLQCVGVRKDCGKGISVCNRDCP
jgi:hypothetical protein